MYRKIINRVALSVLLAFCIASVISCQRTKYKLPEKNLTITTGSGKTVSVIAEIARREEERNYGYMNRKNIPEGTGMLFVFEKDQVLRFWMKDTPHALSIAYIESTGKIRDIYDMAPYSLSDVTSTGSVRYALEVPKGWFRTQGISTGDYLDLNAIR